MLMKKHLIFLILLILFLLSSPIYSFGQGVEITARADKQNFVGGQNIVLQLHVVFPQGASPFWEELMKLDLSPWKIEKTILGERKIFDRDKELSRDLREITFLLSLPPSSVCGSYTIPKISLGYSYFKGKTETKGNATSKPIQVQKVPILVNCSLDKDIATIGENNVFRLTILREKHIKILNYELKNLSATNSSDPENIKNEGLVRWLKSLEVREQKITDLGKTDFTPFKILAKNSNVENQGQIAKEVFEYRFAFYELGGKEFKIPSFHIWYLDEARDEKLRAPKEIVTPPQSVWINLLVRPDRQSLEGLKPAALRPKENFLAANPSVFGYASLVGLMLFGYLAITAVRETRRKKTKTANQAETCQPVYEAQEWLVSLKGSKTMDRETLIKTRNEFFKVLGNFAGISPNTAPAKTSTALITALIETMKTNGKFFGEWILNLKNCLRLLDESILEYKADTDMSAIPTSIEKILSSSEIGGKKPKKKFLIF